MCLYEYTLHYNTYCINFILVVVIGYTEQKATFKGFIWLLPPINTVHHGGEHHAGAWRRWSLYTWRWEEWMTGCSNTTRFPVTPFLHWGFGFLKYPQLSNFPSHGKLRWPLRMTVRDVLSGAASTSHGSNSFYHVVIPQHPWGVSALGYKFSGCSNPMWYAVLTSLILYVF